LGNYLLDRLSGGTVLEERRKLSKVITVLSAFGDESSDESKQRVFAVAALFGDQQTWDALELKWTARTGGIVFHAAECESDQGDFENSPHAKNQELYKDLTTLLAQSGLLGYGSVLDLINQKKYMPDLLPESAYYRCFGEVVTFFAQKTWAIDPDEKVKFTFDRRLETQFNATFLYDYLAALPEWKHYSYLHDEIAFASRKSVGIQAADLWTRELMKHLDNQIGPKKRPTRKSFAALEETHRFGASFYVDDFFDALRQKIDELNNPSLNRTIGQRAYADWLAKNDLTDTFQNRIRFYTQQDALERAKGNAGHFDDVRKLGEHHEARNV